MSIARLIPIIAARHRATETLVWSPSMASLAPYFTNVGSWTASGGVWRSNGNGTINGNAGYFPPLTAGNTYRLELDVTAIHTDGPLRFLSNVNPEWYPSWDIAELAVGTNTYEGTPTADLSWMNIRSYGIDVSISGIRIYQV